MDEITASQTLGDVIARYLAEQCSVITEAELHLRRGDPVVHSTRVAVRRLRSSLRTFYELFANPEAGHLDDELDWWAGLLGRVRDLDIVADRIATSIAALPPEVVVGPVATRVETEILLQRKEGLRAVVEAMNLERFDQLSRQVRRWGNDPPLSPTAALPAVKIKRFVQRADTRARSRLRQALQAYAVGDPAADELLHRSRRSGTRYRYALEAALPVWGDRADRRLEQQKELQGRLGEYQDSILSANFLRALGPRVGSEPEHNGFTYGLLYAQELGRRPGIADQLRALAAY